VRLPWSHANGLEIHGAARTMPLSRIEEAWARTDLRGTRLVIVSD
jgi:hypothetical protein